MTFKESIITCIQYKYCDFKGRASRSEYWWFILFTILVYVGATIVDTIVFGKQSLFYLITALGFFLPSLGVAVRRLHDIDKSGWWVLISLIPIIGLVIIYFFCKAGEPVDNKYGEPPII